MLTQRKRLGLALIGLAAGLFFVVLSLTLYVINVNNFLHSDCPLPPGVCPLHKAVPAESLFGFGIDGILAAIGLFLFFSKEQQTQIVNKDKLKSISDSLEGDDRKIFGMVIDSGAIFQSELVEKSGVTKVKVTRILDKLEAKGLIERKRRGMTNIVMLKQS